jgi:23S rRNA pseudouridine1911/1915/1917 synthase
MKPKRSSEFQPKIAFEDERLLVIEKPACFHSVRDLRSPQGRSVADWLMAEYPGIERASLKAEDAGLINRLDFETSGLLLAAKDRESWEQLSLLLKSGRINKSYTILVEGEFPAKREVAGFIGSRYRHSKKVVVADVLPKGGKRFLEAKAVFARLEYAAQWDASLVRAEAHTARRHQIRAQAAHLGHPLVGDALYGSRRALGEVWQEDAHLPCPPFFLHAERIEFVHPYTRKRVLVVSRNESLALYMDQLK